MLSLAVCCSSRAQAGQASALLDNISCSLRVLQYLGLLVAFRLLTDIGLGMLYAPFGTFISILFTPYGGVYVLW